MTNLDDLQTAVDDLREEIARVVALTHGGGSITEDILDAVLGVRDAFVQVSDECTRARKRGPGEPKLTRTQTEQIGDAVGQPSWQVAEYWPDALDALIQRAESQG